MSQTHTYAILKISESAYNEIRAKLEKAGYEDQFHEDGIIDMHGIAVKAEYVCPRCFGEGFLMYPIEGEETILRKVICPLCQGQRWPT